MIIKSKIINYQLKFIKKISFLKNTLDKNSIYLIDKNVFFLHNLKKLKLKKKILIRSTEASKDFLNLHKIIDKILKHKVTKENKIVCIGGGSLQDTCAFIASIILRGIKWEFYPTSIIAQCDSCIGGKTSINYRGTKNQLGNFYPPKQIVVIEEFLNSIPKNEIQSGIGEMAHYFYVQGGRSLILFLKLYKDILGGNLLQLNRLIKNTLKIKKSFIEKDEFDTGKRLLLNYGHSFGHALEKYFKNKIKHGLAIAHGMSMANFVSYKLGFLDKKKYLNIEDQLEKIYQKKLKKINIKKYINILKLDKKNTTGTIRLILTRGPGKMFMYSFSDYKKFNLILKEYFN
jgi:3-dehydroquinate synthase